MKKIKTKNRSGSMLKTLISAFLALNLIVATLAIGAAAEEDASVFHVDSINGTRWADYLCVYRGLEHTGQNEWGENVVVDSSGTVIEKIPGADARGKNLAIPKGGMVVSGTGEIGKAMYNSAEIGDKCLFDEYSMRVYFSKGVIDPFYTKTIRVTGYNDVRWSNTVIIYNQGGKKTETNVYGYEVCVDADGYIISAGGNDNVVPQGGYVISAIEKADSDFLKMYFTIGAKCTLKQDSVTAVYGKVQLVRTVESELDTVKAALDTARKQYKLIDYDAIEAKIDSIRLEGIDTLEERNEVIAQIREIDPMLVESRSVETRSVWYTATETKASQIKETVAEMKAAGINELVLSTNSSIGTIIPIDTKEIPFACDFISRRLDILQTYIDECHANGIKIIALVPVMGGSFGEKHKEWYDVTNTGEEREEIFFSPANTEYRKVFTDYVRYIITNYDIDGLQLDYIRYPQFYNGVDAGYDEATIKLFEEKTGNGEDVVKEIGKKLTQHPKWNIWWEFKTKLINSWVEEIYGIATELRPDIYVSAAVAASDSVGYYCQDPDAWVKGGYIDGIYVMSYAEEINETTANKPLASRGDNSYLVMGCGAYLSISNKSLIEQTDKSSVLGADGTAYFEWGAVKAHGYTDIFKSSLFKDGAVPFASEVETVVERLIATAKARAELYCSSSDAQKASELKDIIKSLPDKDAGKEAIEAACDAIVALVGNADGSILTADLRSAVRAINMQKSDYEFKKPVVDESAPEESASESTPMEESVSTENSESSQGEEQGSNITLVLVIVGAIVLVAAVAAVLILLKRKKQ